MFRTIVTLRTLPVWALAAVAFTFISATAGVATLAVSTVSTSVQLATDTLAEDASTNIAAGDLTQTSAAISAAGGTAGSAVEATTSMPAVGPGIGAGRWVYRTQVLESGANSWLAGSCLEVEVFADGVLAGSAFIKNATAEAGSIEGVTVKLDAGPLAASSIATTWTSKVTSVTGCS